ncbi:MAG: hypothetical protein ABJA98_21405 [Acidobacteriota bacterium]
MKTLRRLQAETFDAGTLHQEMAPWGFPTDHVLLTTGGDVVAAWRVTGIDREGKDHTELAALTKRMEAAVSQLSPQHQLVEYLIKSPAPDMAIPDGADATTQAAARRALFLNQQPSWVLERFLVLLSAAVTAGTLIPETVRERLTQALYPERVITFVENELVRAIEGLEMTALEIESQLSALGLTRLDKHAIFRLLRQLVNYGEQSWPRLTRDTYVGALIAEHDVFDERHQLRIGPSSVRVLSMMEPPPKTSAGCLDAFARLPSAFILCLTWRRIADDEMRRRLAKRQLFYFNRRIDSHKIAAAPKDRTNLPVMEHAENVQLEAIHNDALKQLATEGTFFGELSLTLVLIGTDIKILDRAEAAARTVMTDRDGVLKKEIHNAVPAWLALVPGNYAHDIRTIEQPATAFADMSPAMFAIHPGSPVNADGQPAMAVLETRHGVPFYLHIPIGLDPHILIVGKTGGGKTFTANTLALWGRRIYERIVIYTIGHGYQHLVDTLGGVEVIFDLEHPSVRLNPFAGEPSPALHTFLVSWVAALLRGHDHDGYTLTGEARAELSDRIQELLEKPSRRLTDLYYTLPSELRERLKPWIAGGPYGSMFDNLDDTLRAHDVIALNLESIYRQHQTLLEPLFGLLFYRDRQWQAASLTPTLELMEEVWLSVTDPTLKANLLFWLKAGRKQNVSVMLITQSLEDLDTAAITPFVLQSCATKIAIPTDDYDRDKFRTVLNLNDEQLRLFDSLETRREFLVMQPDLTRVCRLRVDPETFDICNSPPPGRTPVTWKRRSH